MIKPTKADFAASGIQPILIDDEEYYSIEDVKKKFPQMKFDVRQIKPSEIGNVVPFDAIEPMTEFDLNIRNLWNKPPE